MKKFWKSLSCLILALVCFSSVGCASLNVESVEFYDNLIEQTMKVDKFTFEITAKITEDYKEEEVKLNGGCSFNSENFYFAGELSETSKNSTGETTYRNVDNIYLYNNKVYIKSGYAFNAEKMDFTYNVEEYYTESDKMEQELTYSLLEKTIEFFETIKNNKKEKITEFSKNSFEILFTAQKTDDGYILALDEQKIKNFYNDLKTLTVKELVDKYYGENSFQDLKDDVNELLNKTVNELKTDLNEDSSGKFDELLEKFFEFIIEIGGIEEFTAQEKIKELFDEYGNQKISTVLAQVLVVNEQEIKKNVGAILGMCESGTLFDIAEIDSKTIEIIDGYVTDYADNISCVINFDKKGNLVNMCATVNEVIVDEEKLQLELKIEFGKEFENIASKTSSISANYNP